MCRDEGVDFAQGYLIGKPCRSTSSSSSSCHPPSGRLRTTERCGACVARDEQREGGVGQMQWLQRSVGPGDHRPGGAGGGCPVGGRRRGGPRGRPRPRRRAPVRDLAGLLRHRDARAAGAARRRGRRPAARGRRRRRRAAPAHPRPPQRGRQPDAPRAQARDGRDPRGVRRPGDHHRAHPGAQRGGLHLRDPGLAAVAVAAARADRGRRGQLHRRDGPARPRGRRRRLRDRRQHAQEGRRPQPGARAGPPRPGRQRLRDDHGRRHHARRRLPRGRRASASPTTVR